MKFYEAPEIILVSVNTTDVITASGNIADDPHWTDFY